MHITQATDKLAAALENQLRIAGPEMAEAGTQLMAALRPAVRETLLEVVAMAAAEISYQLDARVVEVRLVDGDPELIVRDDPSETGPPPPSSDTDEARITLRLPSYLKDLISSEAVNAGDSVNSFVVDVLNTATKRRSTGVRSKTTIEL